MFQNSKRIGNILKMLKELEGITPSNQEFVRVFKENPRMIIEFNHFKEKAIPKIAQAINKLHDSSK